MDQRLCVHACVYTPLCVELLFTSVAGSASPLRCGELDCKSQEKEQLVEAIKSAHTKRTTGVYFKKKCSHIEAI